MIIPPRKLGWQARGIARSHNDDDDDNDFSLWFVTVESVIIADREARSPTSLRTPTYFSAARYDSLKLHALSLLGFIIAAVYGYSWGFGDFLAASFAASKAQPKLLPPASHE